jgi:hypothetical protein
MFPIVPIGTLLTRLPLLSLAQCYNCGVRAAET